MTILYCQYTCSRGTAPVPPAHRLYYRAPEHRCSDNRRLADKDIRTADPAWTGPGKSVGNILVGHGKNGPTSLFLVQSCQGNNRPALALLPSRCVSRSGKRQARGCMGQSSSRAARTAASHLKADQPRRYPKAAPLTKSPETLNTSGMLYSSQVAVLKVVQWPVTLQQQAQAVFP